MLRLIDHLAGTLRDGERGYEKAAKLAKDPRLKSLFDDYAHQRVRFLDELRGALRAHFQFEPHKRQAQSVSFIAPGSIYEL